MAPLSSLFTIGNYYAFREITNISKYHHFRFTYDEPGIVYLRELAQSEEVRFNIFKRNPRFPEYPPQEVIPDGLSDERKKYLYKEIRIFFRAGTEDLVAPKP